MLKANIKNNRTNKPSTLVISTK